MASLSLQPIRSQRKAKHTVTVLRQLAQKAGPEGKLPTVRDLCKALKISSATLDDALWELEAQGILKRRQGSGIYVTSRVGRKTIGLVFGGNIFAVGISPFYSMLLDHCARRAKSSNENFSVFMDLPEARGDSMPVHHDLVQAIRGHKLHGLLVAGLRDREQGSWLETQGLPAVIYSVTYPGNHVVRSDVTALIQLGVEALVTQGCRRIGVLGAMGYARPYDEDKRAYQDGLSKHGLSHRPEWFAENFVVNPKGSTESHISNEEIGYQLMKQLFSGWERNSSRASQYPDGLVSLDDMMTRGAIVAANKLGVEVGRDVQIATYANKGSPVLREHEGRLTLLEIDLDELVGQMFAMLETLMEGRKPEQEIILVKPRLVASDRRNG